MHSEKCPECNGSGMVYTRTCKTTSVQMCNYCKGSGYSKHGKFWYNCPNSIYVDSSTIGACGNTIYQEYLNYEII